MCQLMIEFGQWMQLDMKDMVWRYIEIWQYLTSFWGAAGATVVAPEPRSPRRTLWTGPTDHGGHGGHRHPERWRLCPGTSGAGHRPTPISAEVSSEIPRFPFFRIQKHQMQRHDYMNDMARWPRWQQISIVFPSVSTHSCPCDLNCTRTFKRPERMAVGCFWGFWGYSRRSGKTCPDKGNMTQTNENTVIKHRRMVCISFCPCIDGWLGDSIQLAACADCFYSMAI